MHLTYHNESEHLDRDRPVLEIATSAVDAGKALHRAMLAHACPEMGVCYIEFDPTGIGMIDGYLDLSQVATSFLRIARHEGIL